MFKNSTLPICARFEFVGSAEEIFILILFTATWVPKLITICSFVDTCLAFEIISSEPKTLSPSPKTIISPSVIPLVSMLTKEVSISGTSKSTSALPFSSVEISSDSSEPLNKFSISPVQNLF